MIGMACTECGKYPVMNHGWLENPHIYMIFPLKPTCTWCTPDFLGSHVWLPEANRFWFQIAEFPDVPPLPLEPPPVADSCELEEVDVGCSLPCRCGWPAVDPLLEHILIRAKGPAVPDASWVCFPATFEIWGSTRDTWRMLYSSTFSTDIPDKSMQIPQYSVYISEVETSTCFRPPRGWERGREVGRLGRSSPVVIVFVVRLFNQNNWRIQMCVFCTAWHH